MKKAVSLILVLALCLSLCACGNKELKKYAGTYTAEGVFTTASGLIDDPERLYENEVLTLNSDGTGLYTVTANNSIHSVKEGAVLTSADVTWEVSDGYMVVEYSGQRFVTTENNQYKLTDPSPVSNTWTFEIKGNLLFTVDAGIQRFAKS